MNYYNIKYSASEKNYNSMAAPVVINKKNNQ